MIAAIFVETNGVYFNLPHVDPWDIKRDARLYDGPYPVVAHPPCARWCRLAGFVEKVHGYKRGDDGGCFESALRSVRTYGGVLEHPAYSDAFTRFGLPIPNGAWQMGLCGGWSCQVEQWHYGHRAKKTTWLYAYKPGFLPSLVWQRTPDNAVTAYVTDGGGGIRNKTPARLSWCGNDLKSGEKRPRLGAKEASATPAEFRNLLIAIAESAQVQAGAGEGA